MSNPVLREERIYADLYSVAPGFVMPISIQVLNPLLVFPISQNYTQTLLGSTSALLGAGASYQSIGFDVQNYNYITGTCISDQSGILYFQFSSDGGLNFDGEDPYSYIANDKLGFSVPLCSPYFRMKFTNTALIAQTLFRLSFFMSKTCR